MGKLNDCRHCFHDFTRKVCRNEKRNIDESEIVSDETCESCDFFESRYIQYPLTINDIETVPIINDCECCLCEIKPCNEKYEDKSFIGIFFGYLPIMINSSYNKKTGILTNYPVNNPAIFVPELNKIIYGCESFWRKIEKVEDFEGITQEDIENTWYIKLLKNIK